MRRRAFFAALVCAISMVLGVHDRARASVFCEADIQSLIRLDAPKPENPRAPFPRYIISLSTNNPESISGDVVLVTDEAAYDVPFSSLQSGGSAKSAGFETQPQLIAFPDPLEVRFAWIDSVGVNGAPPHDCPTYPQPETRLEETPPVRFPSDPYMIGRLPTLAAHFKMNLPPTDCAEPYTAPKLLDEPKGNPRFWDTSQGLKAALKLRAYLDSDGRVADVQVTQSSGSPAVDNLGKATVIGSRYRPAVFRCVPVVSTIDVDFTWEIRP